MLMGVGALLMIASLSGGPISLVGIEFVTQFVIDMQDDGPLEKVDTLWGECDSAIIKNKPNYSVIGLNLLIRESFLYFRNQYHAVYGKAGVQLICEMMLQALGVCAMI